MQIPVYVMLSAHAHIKYAQVRQSATVCRNWAAPLAPSLRAKRRGLPSCWPNNTFHLEQKDAFAVLATHTGSLIGRKLGFSSRQAAQEMVFCSAGCDWLTRYPTHFAKIHFDLLAHDPKVVFEYNYSSPQRGRAFLASLSAAGRRARLQPNLYRDSGRCIY